MIDNSQKTSNLVLSQLPEYVRDNPEYANFNLFLKAYYEWMETTGKVTDRSKNLLNYKDVDATVAITAAVNNKVFIATKASLTQTFTLPAASTAGLQYTFICGDAGGELKILGSAGDTIKLKTAAGGTLLSIAADTGIKNTAATNIVGDTITLVSDGVTFWYAVSQNGIFASN